MITEIKKIIVIRLLKLALNICPKGDFQFALAQFILTNTYKL